METVNNIASTATKMIWGDSKAGEEPVNGQTGAGTASEPFDKGNDVCEWHATFLCDQPFDLLFLTHYLGTGSSSTSSWHQILYKT
jgi:hypothetical protein